MLLSFCHYFLVFIIYSFIGWSMEVILTMIKTGKFVNRGFLIGPYCPIYGYGSLIITIFLKRYLDNFVVLFILAMVICMILEYITSYLMEKLFKARWWDYSDQKYNINGRVCLETAVPFGIGALIIMYIVHPVILKLINSINIPIIYIIAIFLFIVMLTDTIISCKIISKFKHVNIKIRKDSTEEITNKIKEYLVSQSKLTRRLISAFPNLEVRINNFKEKQKELQREIKEKQKRLKKEFKEKQKELKNLRKGKK